MTTRIVVIGGDPAKAQNSIVPKLEKAGGDVIEIIGANEQITNLPAKTDLAIFLADCADHKLYKIAREAAARLSIPFVTGSRNWSRTVKLLEQLRIVTNGKFPSTVKAGHFYEDMVAELDKDGYAVGPDAIGCDHSWKRSKSNPQRHRCRKRACRVIGERVGRVTEGVVICVLRCATKDCMRAARNRFDAKSIKILCCDPCHQRLHDGEAEKAKAAQRVAAEAAQAMVVLTPEPKEARPVIPKPIAKPVPVTVAQPDEEDQLDIQGTINAIIDLLEEPRREFNSRMGAALKLVRRTVPQVVSVLERESDDFNDRIDGAIAVLRGEATTVMAENAPATESPEPPIAKLRQSWKVRGRVVPLLLRERKALTVDQITRALHIPEKYRGSVAGELARACRDGLLVRVARGVYRHPKVEERLP